MRDTMRDDEHAVEYVTIHGHRRAFVRAGSGPALLLLHGLGCDHTTWEPGHRVAGPALHRDRARPARPRQLRQAPRRLQRRRLRERDARPAERPGHRPGHRGRAQPRRRRGDAVRLPVPRAHRAARAGRPRRLRPRGDAGDPRRHHAGLPPAHGRPDAAGHPARVAGRPPRAGADAHPADPRPGRGGRHHRVVRRQPDPGRDPARGARRGRLEGPDHHHDRPRLPDRATCRCA